jgi:hypothetical protein
MSRGFLGTGAGKLADLNLLVQIAMLALLTYAIIQGKRGKAIHCQVMPILVIINAAMIVAIMNPAFFRALPAAARHPTNPRPIIMWPHALLGAIAEMLGVYVAIAVSNSESRAANLRRLKWLKRITVVLWSVSLVLGIALYAIWYL